MKAYWPTQFMGEKGMIVLEYKKDGQTIRLEGLWDRVTASQKVILLKVSFGPNHPLSRYEQPAAFTVIGRPPPGATTGDLKLLDTDGREVIARIGDAGYMYDSIEWGLFQFHRQQEVERRKQAKIDQLDAHLNMLKSILIAQGFRIVTAEQAETLGLKTT